MTKWGMVTFWHERRRTEACRDDVYDHILTTGSMSWMQAYGTHPCLSSKWQDSEPWRRADTALTVRGKRPALPQDLRGAAVKLTMPAENWQLDSSPSGCLQWPHWLVYRRRKAEPIKRGIAPLSALTTAWSAKGPWHIHPSPGIRMALNNPCFARLGLIACVCTITCNHTQHLGYGPEC